MEVECLALKDLTSVGKSFSVPKEDGSQGEKENVCLERRRSTPLKPSESSVPVFLVSRKASTADLAHITPIKCGSLAEPWSPTANLKVLISAASPDIRDREMKKVLFRPMENDKDQVVDSEPAVEDAEVEDPTQFEGAFEEDDAEKKPSRKEKSLGLLCQKFLALYPDDPPAHSPIWISLDEVATNLGVERRRIYDIVNVLESLTIVGRMAKNSYTWYGRQRLWSTLEVLQRKGREQGYHLQMDLPAEARRSGLSREEDGGDGDSGNAAGNRKDKSLRIMSQKFVMLFLVSKTQTVTLDAAAKVLIEESQDSSSHSKYKTKVRRLYDIANVLTSLELIRKVHVREERARKPAFKWLGPVKFSSSGNMGSTLDVAQSEATANEDFRKAKMARHSSFTITPAGAGVKRQVSSAPSSPRHHLAGIQNQSLDYSRKTMTNSSVSQLQCGSSTDSCLGMPLYAQLTHTASSSLPPASTHPTVVAAQPCPEHLLVPSPHCLAYLPSLSHPSVVMLYKPPEQQEWAPEGQRSAKTESEDEGKRRRESGESEEEEAVLKKKSRSGSETSEKTGAQSQRKAPMFSETGNTSAVTCPSGQQRATESRAGHSIGENTQPSHYLYVPNNAGLNNFNFLIPAGQPAANLSLPPSNVPTMAVPYVLVPSAALSHYPLVAGGVQQQQTSDNPSGLRFSLPTMISPAAFMVGTAPHSVMEASEVSVQHLPSPVTPEQARHHVLAAGTPRSPSGLRQNVGLSTPEPSTPHTPKETTASSSKAFFQTPGTLGNVVSAVPAARKRGSAQRRLDVGHSAAP
ncbi:PREDICTED: transcription factor E2F7 isoform X1 [Poecilia mexicana]|uniref:transcription factor E2F7 isoform X1 n=1 Tax=Poecilia mexicana TaxID=48701 RepID=UPI00072E384C|nr:PREDICTED: transcription factor E2F7 isoform X1 [Poecilia mexicana]